MGTEKVVALYSRVAYKPTFALDSQIPEIRRISEYFDKGQERELDSREVERLTSGDFADAPAVAKSGSDEAKAANRPYGPPVVEKPGGGPPDEPTDAGETATDGGPVSEAQVAAAMALLMRAGEEGNFDLAQVAENMNAPVSVEPADSSSADSGPKWEPANENQAALNALTVKELTELGKKQSPAIEPGPDDRKADLVEKLDAAGVKADQK